MSLFQLTYISRSTERFNARDLPELINDARDNNAVLHVTGALYFAAGRFIQVLEGEEPVVRALFDTIARDPRHTEIEIVAMRPIERRRFSEWSMGALSPGLAARAAKEAFGVSRGRSQGWSDETLDEILSGFQRALKPSPPR